MKNIEGRKFMKVLIVDDEKKLADVVSVLLAERQIKSDVAYDGEDGYEKAIKNGYDVIILDVMMPKMNGFEVLSALRKDGIKTPVIMLTAKDAVPDKVKGLDLGADDYLTKPFDGTELAARVNALLRRGTAFIPDVLSYGDITLDCATGELTKNDESVILNYKEKEILRLLLASPKNVVTRDIIIDKVWGWNSDGGEGSLEAYMSFLRKKLRFLSSSVTIKNYQKTGYKIETSEEKK